MNSAVRSLDDLLQHERFVERLARSLLGSDDEANDLVQETWLRAMRHPPDERGEAVGWLGTVVRNLARDWRVGSSRRERREAVAARTEATPPLQTVIERQEVQRQIVNALRRLPEPHASAIVLRFFDGLPPREIARRLSLPVETVRKRLNRGLKELREELDETFEGGRAGWTASLPVLFGVPGSGTATAATASVPAIVGGLVMSTTAKVLCALLLVVVGAVFVMRAFFRSEDSMRTAQARDQAGVATDPPTANRPAPAPIVPRSFQEILPETSPSVAEGKSAEGSEAPPSAIPAVIRGRCLDAQSSAPLPACTIKIHGWPSIQAKLDAFVKLHGPIDWKDPPEQSTGSDGTFEVAFAPPDPYQFILTISAPGRATMQGRWHALKSAEHVDLGDLIVPRGTVLRGRVVDERGSVKTGITLSLSGADDPKAKVTPKNWYQQTIGTDGTFAFSDLLPAGSFAVEVQGVELIEPRTIEIREDERTRTVDIRVREFSDADAITGTVTDDRGAPIANASVDYSPRGGSMHRTLSSGKDGAFRIQRTGEDSKDPVTISVRCAGYESSESSTRYEWGINDVAITLRRGATVTVVVQDGDLGKPLDRFGVRCFGTRGPGTRASDATRLRNRGEHPNGVLDLDGVLRGRQFLVVEPEGDEWLPSRGQEFEMTEEGGPRQEVTVWRPVRKTVIVRSHDGKPIAGTKIELLRPVAGTPVDLKTRALSTSQLATQGFWQCAFLLDDGKTDDDGRLEMKGAPHELLVLRALGPGHAPLLREVRFDGPETSLEIVVPKGATLVGKILPLEILAQLDGRALDCPSREHNRLGPGVTLRLGGRGGVEFPLSNEKAPIDADGTFRLDGIPPGTWSVHLHYLDGPQGVKQSRGSVYSIGSGSVQIGKFDFVDGAERHEAFDLTRMLKAEVEGILTIDGKPVDGGALAFDGLVDGSPDDHISAQQIGIGSDGAFRASVWPARYRLILQTMRDGKRKCVQTPELLVLSAGEKVRRTFDFHSSILEFRVVASDGVTPVSGALLEIHVPEPSWPGWAERSDADGRTSVEDLPAGPVTVFAWPKGLSTPEAQREFFGSGTRREDVLLRVATVVITPPETKATIVLPNSTGY